DCHTAPATFFRYFYQRTADEYFGCGIDVLGGGSFCIVWSDKNKTAAGKSHQAKRYGSQWQASSYGGSGGGHIHL
ncbi:unnamed protein product, partial [marine sediment metagenome]